MNETTGGETAPSHPGSAPVSVRRRIPSGDAAPAAARAVAAQAAAGLPEELVERATLAVSELVTNAVRHGSSPGEPIELVIERTTAGCSIVVADQGRATPPEHDGSGGFGLDIVAQLTDALTITHDPGWVVRAVFTPRRRSTAP